MGMITAQRLPQPEGGKILASMLQRKPASTIPVVSSQANKVIRKTVTSTASTQPSPVQPQTTTSTSPAMSKDNLYIVALPQGHPLRQGQNMVVLKPEQGPSPISSTSASTTESPIRICES